MVHIQKPRSSTRPDVAHTPPRALESESHRFMFNRERWQLRSDSYPTTSTHGYVVCDSFLFSLVASHATTLMVVGRPSTTAECLGWPRSSVTSKLPLDIPKHYTNVRRQPSSPAIFQCQVKSWCTLQSPRGPLVAPNSVPSGQCRAQSKDQNP
jgi:hypothetical protein